MVEFVSYNGKYPCLCMGDLVLKINGKTVKLHGALVSGGSVSFYNNYADVSITSGDWDIDLCCVPEEYHCYYDSMVAVVNKNVHHGCCGGCV